MKNLQLFNFNGNEVRAMTIDDKPWFVATDACKILGLKNTTIALQRLDEDERSKLNLGRQGKTNIVNEYGLYTLILASRKPEAHKFKRWITHEVLPTINKHGAYMTDAKAEAIVTDKNALADLLKQASDQLKEKDIQIAEMRPKALFADAITESHTSILVGALAKILRQNGIDIGTNRLFQWMRDNHYLISRKGRDWNTPTQYSMDLGLFEIKESTHMDGNGVNVITKTPTVTGKGQKYFINKFFEMKKKAEI